MVIYTRTHTGTATLLNSMGQREGRRIVVKISIYFFSTRNITLLVTKVKI